MNHSEISCQIKHIEEFLTQDKIQRYLLSKYVLKEYTILIDITITDYEKIN